MMGLAGLLGTVELKSRWSVCLWLFVPPENQQRRTTTATGKSASNPRQTPPAHNLVPSQHLGVHLLLSQIHT